MFSQLLNWRTLLATVAIAIVTGTIFYSNYLAKKIENDERRKVKVWVESLKTRSTTDDQAAINLTNVIANENIDIPIIGADENDNPIGEFLNLNAQKVKSDTGYLRKKIIEFKKNHNAIKVEISKDPLIFNNYYYGDSELLKEVQYYPIIQLVIVALFICITIVTINVRNKSTQNQVWAGMAKEAAHQLGTPLSSLKGWLEMLKEISGNEKIAAEMSKDLDRLNLVSERFGKIGSKPQLETSDVMNQIETMVNYIKRRSSEKVSFTIINKTQANIVAQINPSLFDWVIENLLKNALDAMEGQGQIKITVENENQQIKIDVSDTGKGIEKKYLNAIFKPGFTTKKRGWGLGLSLSKRIIEQYHEGHLFVKSSDVGKGTTFRIILSSIQVH